MNPYQAKRTDPHASFRNALQPNVRRRVDPRTPYGIPQKASPEGGTDSGTPRRRHTSQDAHLRNRQELVHRVLAISRNPMAEGITVCVGIQTTLFFASNHADSNRPTRTVESETTTASYISETTTASYIIRLSWFTLPKYSEYHL